MTKSAAHLRIIEETSAYWRVLFDNPLSTLSAPGAWADGRVWMRPDGTKYFAGDLSEQEQKLVWAVQGVPTLDLPCPQGG